MKTCRSGQFTIEEGLAMRGTEFIYEFEDKTTVKAFVKAFDLKIGFSCYALRKRHSDGKRISVSSEEKKDGGYACLISSNLKTQTDRNFNLTAILRALKEIRDTGRYRCRKNQSSNPVCPFRQVG